ncbi:MAG: hypothetical protein JOZ19_04810 [Rubrobacter sp.]|nr:hypothetical protein [Rubrobacter sp.]
MVKVSIELGAAGFLVLVTAESIRHALRMAEERYPGLDTRVVLPLDPGTFFAAEPATAGIEHEIPESAAG